MVVRGLLPFISCSRWRWVFLSELEIESKLRRTSRRRARVRADLTAGSVSFSRHDGGVEVRWRGESKREPTPLQPLAPRTGQPDLQARAQLRYNRASRRAISDPLCSTTATPHCSQSANCDSEMLCAPTAACTMQSHTSARVSSSCGRGHARHRWRRVGHLQAPRALGHAQ